MDEIDTTNPVDGEALAETEVDSDGGAAAEPMLDDEGNLIDAHDGDEEGPDADEAEAEQLEIERDGKIAKIPAWLKPELMMQADYTRKTQELADARRALEAERTTAQHASDAEISAQANLSLIDGQIAQFNKVDWNAWHDSDPFAAQKAFAQFQLLKDARQQTEHYLGHVRQEPPMRLDAYRCPANVWTIGYGSTGPHVRAGMRIDAAEAEALLRGDVARFEEGMGRIAGRCTQGQYDALVCFAFNLGLGALMSSTLLKKHKAGDHRAAAAEFARWVNAGGRRLPGLVRRRAAEAELYLS